MISYYGSWKKSQFYLPTTANKIRHTFDKLSDETFLCTAVYQLDKFAENEKFADDSIGKLKELLENEKVFSFWRKNELRNSITQTDLPDDFYEKILGNLSESEKYEKLFNEIEELRKSIFSGNIKPTDYFKEVGKLNNKQQELEKIDLSLVGSGFAYRNQLINERTRRNYKTELIALSDEQKKILEYVENNFLKKDGNPKDMLIVGGPGTGKTLTLICILIMFVTSRQKKSAILLTYYDSLNKYIKYLFELYNNFNQKIFPEKLLNTVVQNLKDKKLRSFDSFMFKIFKKLYGLKFNTLKSKDKNCEDFLNTFKKNPDEKNAYRIAETVIWPDMKNESEFCGTDPNKHRTWKLIQKIRERFLSQSPDSAGLKTVPDVFAYYYFNEFFSDPNQLIALDKTDFIIIDESQDLTNAQIAAVKKLATNCFFAGDMNQSIRNPKVSWTKLGLDIIGGQYKQTLKENFRSTKEIQDVGQSYLKYCSVKDSIELEPQGNGPKPKLFVVDRQNLYTNLVNAVKFYMDASQDLDDICVVAFSDSELDEIWCVFDDCKIKSYRILNDDYDFNGQQPAVRLSTVENIKGIDCVHLFFVADSDNVSEDKSKISNENLPNAIFTCITRAMCSLQVFMVNCDPINPALENLMEVMGKKGTPLVKPVSQPQAQNVQPISVPEIKSTDDMKSTPLAQDSSPKTVDVPIENSVPNPQVQNVISTLDSVAKPIDETKTPPLMKTESAKKIVIKRKTNKSTMEAKTVVIPEKQDDHKLAEKNDSEHNEKTHSVQNENATYVSDSNQSEEIKTLPFGKTDSPKELSESTANKKTVASLENLTEQKLDDKKDTKIVSKNDSVPVQKSKVYVKRLGTSQELKNKELAGKLIACNQRSFNNTSFSEWMIENDEFSNKFITRHGNRMAGLKIGDNVQFKVWSVTESGEAKVDITKKIN